MNAAIRPSASYDANPAMLPTSRNEPGSSSASIRSRQVSLPRLRWRTTPGSSEPGARRAWASACSLATSSRTGSQVSSRATSIVDGPASSDGSITATISSPASDAPTARSATAITRPLHGAVTVLSIFIALTTTRPSPARTTSPAATRTSTIVPPIGLRAACCPVAAGSGGRAGAAVLGVAPTAAPAPPTSAATGLAASADRSGTSASSVVRASAWRTSGRARMPSSWARFVGRPAISSSSTARRARSTASATSPLREVPITLASSGSNCGGGV
ncbi:MAG: hypothetical protein QM733_23115 [Ilumatobacteraceae bacterium]